MLGRLMSALNPQDLHRFDLDQQTWRLEDPAVRPPPREMHTLVDSGNRMILYGGTRCASAPLQQQHKPHQPPHPIPYAAETTP